MFLLLFHSIKVNTEKDLHLTILGEKEIPIEEKHVWTIKNTELPERIEKSMNIRESCIIKPVKNSLHQGWKMYMV